jgi:hypothetical protein
MLKGSLQIVQEVVFLVVRQPEKPPHTVQGVRDHAVDGHRAGALTGRMAAYSVSNNEKLALRLPEEPCLIVVSQICLVDAQRFAEIGNEKPIFVQLSSASPVAKAA